MKSVPSPIREFTSIASASEARDGNRPLVLLFCAAHCPASRTLERMTNELAPAYRDRLRFVSVNAAKATDLMRRYCIHSIPSLVIVDHENTLYLAMGVLPRRELETIFDAAARHLDDSSETPTVLPES